jgi:hypothetical protein
MTNRRLTKKSSVTVAETPNEHAKVHETGVTQHQARSAQSTTLDAARGLINPSCANYPGNRSYNPSGILMLMNMK